MSQSTTVVYGVSKIETGDINATTGLGENWQDVGEIVKGTAAITKADSETVEHRGEFSAYVLEKVETFQGQMSIKFDAYDILADTMQRYCGGDVTDVVDQPDEWSAPIEVPNINLAVRITSANGAVFEFRRCLILGKMVGEPRRDGTYRLEVMCEVLQPLVAGVPPWKKIDHKATNVS